MGFLKNLFLGAETKITTYAEFWEWFVANERRFYAVIQKKDPAAIEREFFPLLGPKLDELKDGIFYLTGMLKDGVTVDLVFTADGITKNIVFVEELVAAAPSIDGWQFTCLKQPAADAFDLRMNGITFNQESLSFYPNDHADEPDLIDITVVHEAFDHSDDDSVKNGGYIFLDNFLGELSFLEDIDQISFAGPSSTERDLIPISALENFLDTRRALFVEKYDGVRVFTDNDQYSSMEGEFHDGSPLVAIVNTTLMNWDSKASHPWMMVVTIKFDGSGNNGLADNETYDRLNEIEDVITDRLRDADGYLNIGRETGKGERTIFFSCIDYREPSKAAHEVKRRFGDAFEMDYRIYKDKYWQTVSHFTPPE